MTIKQSLESEMKKAMKAKDHERLSVLRMIKSEFLLKEKEEGEQLDDKAADQALLSMLKKYKKSRDEYESFGKHAEARQYDRDITVIESFLSAPMMDETEIKEELTRLASEMNVTDPKEFGKVMKTFMSQHSNADGKLVSSVLKEILKKE